MSLRLITRSVWHNPGNRGHRLRHAFAAVAWQIRKRVWGKPRVLRLANGLRFRAHPDCVVSSALIYSRWPEYAELQFLRSQLRRDDVVLDVGANVGHLSLLLADVVGPGSLFAFEPTPLTFRRLVQNWQLNDWPTDQLFQVAVGAEAGQVLIPDSDRPETKNQVSKSQCSGPSVAVPLVRLDDYRHRWAGRKLGLLKIDVEGYEREVFRGGQQLLEVDRPGLIMFESLAGSVEAEIAALLQRVRYEVFQLDANGVPDFHHAVAQNLFAVPTERRREVCRD